MALLRTVKGDLPSSPSLTGKQSGARLRRAISTTVTAVDLMCGLMASKVRSDRQSIPRESCALMENMTVDEVVRSECGN